jgi:hypothetical protein
MVAMIRRPLLSTALALGLFLALATPAAAEVEVDYLDVDPKLVVLKNTDNNGPTDFYAGAFSTEGDIARLDLVFTPPHETPEAEGLTLDDWELLEGTASDGLWATSFLWYRTARPGTWTVRATAGVEGGEDVISEPVTFQLKRNTVISKFNATEPVRKGYSTTASGTLIRLDPAARAYVGYSGKTVSIQFRASGTSTYRTVATVKTSSTGKFSKKVVATRDGRWRAVFGGTTYYMSSVSASDYVDVR